MKIRGRKVVTLTDNEKEVLRQARRIVDDLIEEVDNKNIDNYNLCQASDDLYNLIYSNEFIINLDPDEEDAE